MTICGIDLGLFGAFAVLGNGTARFVDMPTFEVKKSRFEYDLASLKQHVAEISEEQATFVIEQVFVGGIISKLSLLGLGRASGIVEGMVTYTGLPLVRVRPEQWKRELAISPKSKKVESVLRACELFPHLASDIQEPANQKRREGRAEALLIAEYHRRKAGSLESRIE